MATVLVTGANRGIGLEFCRQYAADGASVVATCRSLDKADELRALGVEIHPLDTADPASAASLAGALAGRPIDILINNAGVLGDRAASALDADLDEWVDAFRINALGPAIVTRALLPNLLLATAPVAATMGSQAGIFAKMEPSARVIYQSTKAAAHAVTLSLASALADKGVIYVSLRPGRTRTDMTGPEADFTAEDSVRKLRAVLARVEPAWAGQFIDRSGRIFPYDGNFEGS